MATVDFDPLRRKFAAMSMLIKIIIINVTIFVGLHLAVFITGVSGVNSPESAVLHCIEMPSALPELIVRPWTVVTYMFAQYDVMHLLFNMLWLYWFGVLFQDFWGERTLFWLYIGGGLTGAVVFLFYCNLLPGVAPYTNWLIGASAGVIAIVAATAIMMPDFKFNLLFLGPVSLKWIAIVTIGLDLLGITGTNAGGHIAHLGGAIAGAAFALHRKRAMRRPIFNPAESADDIERDRARLDVILEKIKRSGYTALTPDERRLLFEISNREKKR